ncbi:MAG: cytochrome-c oxidase, cbb3-type subunit III [Gammaproteobacteria bacterium]|nr:cytochrome-c oxidase, cbb3-type subunit III [Gammaproteobacteria bacterium]
MSTAWSWVVIIGSLGSILFFYVVLQLNRQTGKESGETTGHIHDGIEEYDNPLPAWWYWLFVLTMIYGVGYLIWYPGLGNFPGIADWTSVGELETDQEASRARYEPLFAKYRQLPVAEIYKVPAAVKMGQRLFANNCSVCHGSTAAGGFGFPDLIDDVWTWGAEASTIKQTILHGRKAAMPAWGTVIGDQGIRDVTAYILSLNNREADPDAVAQGETLFGNFCIACHGPEGKGLPALGAPDLTNGIWLYGNSRSRIEFSIRNGRNGEMPGFKHKLGENKAHILAGYVYGLSR